MQIREDLKDISNTVVHLIALGDYLCNKYREWTTWWGKNDIRMHLVKTKDKQILNIGTLLYNEGRDSAYELGLLLQEIDSIKRCPRLKDYVSKVKAFRQNCILTGEKLLSQCEQIISTRKSCGMVPDIQLMMDWHKETFSILRNLDSELSVIEKSERYKIEEIMLMQEKLVETEQGKKTELGELHKWYRTNTFKGAIIALVVALLGGGIPSWLSLRDKEDIPKTEKSAVTQEPNNYSLTPLYFRTKKRVDDFYESIRNDKLDPWLFINAGVEVRVTKYNGDVINYNGILFTGAPRTVFWSDDFIPPFIEDAIIKVFDQTIDECRKNSLDPEIYVYEAKRILGDFIYRVYNRMADMDQKLMKHVHTENSGRRDVKLEIEKMCKYLDEQYNAALLLSSKGKNTN